jgi:hypothetical protein
MIVLPARCAAVGQGTDLRGRLQGSSGPRSAPRTTRDCSSHPSDRCESELFAQCRFGPRCRGERAMAVNKTQVRPWEDSLASGATVMESSKTSESKQPSKRGVNETARAAVPRPITDRKAAQNDNAAEPGQLLTGEGDLGLALTGGAVTPSGSISDKISRDCTEPPRSGRRGRHPGRRRRQRGLPDLIETTRGTKSEVQTFRQRPPGTWISA